MNPKEEREKKFARRKSAKNSNRRSQPKALPPTAPKVARTELDLFDEVAYIIQRAQDGESRAVVMGDFVLFSTSTGDAWLLDSADNFAMCLLLEQQPQSYQINETPTAYAIEWQMEYAFDGDEFVLTDGQGQILVLSGYPVSEIQQAISTSAKLRARHGDSIRPR